MNQIIYTENKKSGSVEIRNVVIFFIIAMIIFGISFIAQGSYAMVTAAKQNKQLQEQEKGPDIQIQRNETSIILVAENEKPIYTVAYNWNGQNEKTLDAQAKTKFQTEIDLPVGTNILNITITDVNQKSHKYQKEYYVEGTGKPSIELAVTNKNQIRMTAKDILGLQSIIYRWNNQDPVTVQASAEDSTTIETIVDIPIGQNTLNVTAINNNNIETTKTLDIKGVKKPTITLLKQSDGLYIKVEDEEGIKEINYTLNGNKYTINSTYFGTNNKVVEYTQPLAEGENYIILEAYNVSGIVEEYKGRCEYP